MLPPRPRPAILKASSTGPLQGRVSISPEPTAAQYRFLVFALAHHGPGTTAFRPVAMPLDFILGPGLASGPPEAVERAVWALFGSTSPVLAVRALNAAGKVRRKGSWSLLPLLADFQYTSADAYLVGRMNDRLLDYLPQLLELLPSEALEGLPLAERPRRLRA